MRLIDADAKELNQRITINFGAVTRFIVKSILKDAPTIDAVPVTAPELKHLINDTIAYIWRMEECGLDKPEYGYESRKALLEKLKQFEKEHFPEMGCTCGG